MGVFLRDNLQIGAFSYHKFIFLLACIDRWKAYNRLVSACTIKTAIEVQRLCVSTSKNGTLVGLFRFSLSCLFACAAINRENLAFRTTIIEDTHLTLAVIPFKLEANNCLICLSLQTYEKKFAKFPFLLVYNSLARPNCIYILYTTRSFCIHSVYQIY